MTYLKSEGGGFVCNHPQAAYYYYFEGTGVSVSAPKTAFIYCPSELFNIH